ncbi:MAG TPA: hypothetical protein VLV49_04685 [Terriglobales bacterium]|nr:hypothetical protein [Terriglobales bacterium]
MSYQAVKTKVYRLIDALVEGAKTEDDVRESMRRWWKLIHPADRAVAQKYILTVLAKSNASLGAISDGLFGIKEFAATREPEVPIKSAKIPRTSTQAQAASTM